MKLLPFVLPFGRSRLVRSGNLPSHSDNKQRTRQTSPIRWVASVAGLTLAAGALLLGPGASGAGVVYMSAITDTPPQEQVHQFDLSTGADLGVFATAGLNSPRGLALDSAGNLYVLNSTGGTGGANIEKFTPGGVGSIFAASTGLNDPFLRNPSSLAFDSAGNLFVADTGRNTIQKFTPDGVGSMFVTTGLNGPTALAFDSTGNLYVANFGSNAIEKFTPGGVGSIFASTGLNGPNGLAFDSTGNLYVANTPDDAIEKFTPDGVGSLFATAGVRSPVGLACDSAGNLYVANNGDGMVEKFTPGGVGSLFASTQLRYILAIAVREVPEPSAFALLALGATTLMIARRRR